MVDHKLSIALATLMGSTPMAFAQVESSSVADGLGGSEVLMDGDDWADFDDFGTDPSASSNAGIDPDAGRGFASRLGVEIHGFVEAAAASRLVSDPHSVDDFVLGESRGRLDLGVERPRAKAKLKVDFIGDAVTERVELDLREAWADFSLGSALSIRAGRQVLTWGTGDFLFLNDLFPKDFQAFFIGREDEFLKAPSDALKLSLFLGGVGWDVVWTPIFAPDRFIRGERLSFFFVLPEPGQTGPAASFTPLDPARPDKDLENGEWSTRVYGTVAGWELAAYGYVGFYKQPLTITDPAAFGIGHSRLGVYGASVRGLLFGGVVSAEGAFYHSHDDVDGTDPFVPNSQVRALLGYEFEPLPRFTVGVQGYLEAVLQHDQLLRNSPFPRVEPEAFRGVVTVRLGYRMLSDNLRLSLFTFVSPSEVDAYLRPRISYKFTEAVEGTVGANILFGRDPFTFFGQLDGNTNGYARLRFTF